MSSIIKTGDTTGAASNTQPERAPGQSGVAATFALERTLIKLLESSLNVA